MAVEGARPEALRSLRGAFALVIWDPTRRIGWLARDQLGGRSLFWARTAQGVLFADELPALLARLRTTPSPDEEVLTSWLASGTVPIGRTFYERIQRLPPGHAVRLGAARSTAWWALGRRPVLSGDADALGSATVEQAAAAIARVDDDERVPAVLLSGGLDSSTVLALLTRGRTASGRRPPVSYSAVFGDDQQTDERSYIHPLIDHLGVPAVEHEPRLSGVLESARAQTRRWRQPSMSPNGYLWRPLYDLIRRDGHATLIDGEGGDEVFGAQVWVLVDHLRRGRPRTAFALAGQFPGIGRRGSSRKLRARILLHLARQTLPRSPGRRPLVSPLMRPAAARLASATFDPMTWRKLDGPLWQRRLRWALTDERELLDAHGLLRRSALASGLDVRHPFLTDVDLLEFAVSVPPDVLLDAYLDRPLLRRGLAGIVPDVVRLRRGKTTFNRVTSAAVARDLPGIRQLLLDPGAEVHRWLSPDPLRESLRDEETVQGQLLAVFRALAAELWLREAR